MNRKTSLALFSENENLALKKKVENLVSGIKSGKLVEEQVKSDERIKSILNRVLKIHAGCKSISLRFSSAFPLITFLSCASECKWTNR